VEDPEEDADTFDALAGVKAIMEGRTMSAIDDVLEANDTYARRFALGHLPKPPARKLAIVACMDARMNVEQILGLQTGDAHIIRNAGGVVSDDVLRSLLISHYLLGTQEFMVINHTDCGMVTFRDEDLRNRLQQTTGTAVVAPVHFYAFQDVVENVRQQIQKVRSHPWVPRHIPIRGFLYGVETGKLTEVAG
jgi:carbonic anhydrase